MASSYSFGIWDDWQSFVAAAEEGLRMDRSGNVTSAPIYYGSDGQHQTEARLQGNPTWYEVDTSQPLLPQTQYENLTRYVNQTILDDYELLFENLETKMDMGGVLDKDRLVPTSNPIGIFSFGLASPTLYRKVEFYVPDLDVLVDGLYVTMLEMNGVQKFYTTIEGKQYSVWRQQEGTQDILKNVPDAKRIMLEDGMYISDPSSGVGADGTEYRLKFATKTKKIYLEKPKQTGEAQYVDLFVSMGGNSNLNSNAMFSKTAPILMLAEKLENAGVRTRIYASIVNSRIGTDGINNAIYSYVAKEYGQKIDIDRIATLTNDPRLFRGKMIAYLSGLYRKQSKVSRDAGGTSIIYEDNTSNGNAFTKSYAVYKNYLKKLQGDGLFNSKVKDKALMIASSIDPRNDFSRNEDKIVEEFYRISDIAELVLAKEPEKAVRRMFERDKKRGKTASQIKEKLKTSVNKAFFVVTPSIDSEYKDKKEEVEKLTDREARILAAINKIVI